MGAKTGAAHFWSRAVAVLVVGVWAAAVWQYGVRGPRQLAVVLLISYLVLWGVGALLTRVPLAELGARFLLSTLGLLLVWIPLEVAAVAGFVDYRPLLGAPISEWWYVAHYNRRDNELLYIHRPYLQLAGTQPGDVAAALCLRTRHYRYDVHYDGHGFRNPRDLTAADIVVIGDSFIEAPTIAEDKVVTSVLARLLGATVANLGMSAYGPQQELAVLRRYALPLHPRLIVWAFYEGNDLKDVGRYEKYTAGAPPSGMRLRLDASFTRNVFHASYRLLKGCQPQPDVTPPTGILRDAEGRSQRMYFAVKNDTLSPADLRHLSTVRSILRAAHGLSSDHGSRLLVAFVPTSFRVYKDLVICLPDSDCAHWSVNDLPQRLQSMVSDIAPDLGYVDLTPAFVEEARRGRVLYRLDDSHWTEDGHRVAAEAIAKAMPRDVNVGTAEWRRLIFDYATDPSNSAKR
jgi:hypothetical protein